MSAKRLKTAVSKKFHPEKWPEAVRGRGIGPTTAESHVATMIGRENSGAIPALAPGAVAAAAGLAVKAVAPAAIDHGGGRTEIRNAQGTTRIPVRQRTVTIPSTVIRGTGTEDDHPTQGPGIGRSATVGTTTNTTMATVPPVDHSTTVPGKGNPADGGNTICTRSGHPESIPPIVGGQD